MNTLTLGDLTTSAQGLGCMGMSSIYGPADWDGSVATVRRALDLGVTLIDTATAYGMGHNEVLVGRAIAGRRDEVQLASKAGIDFTHGRGRMVLRGDADYLKAAVDFSLQRLGVEYIDLYYLHRVAPDTPVEESVGALGELVTEGKIRAVGLSEVSGDQLRAAHAVHPITAVQSEYSLWTRDPETSVVGAARDLGVGLVAYSPLGRGFLTGTIAAGSLDAGDVRRRLPRFQDANLTANEAVTGAVTRVAERHGATPAQIAIAWVSAQAGRLGIPVIPIPGTTRVGRLEQNAAAERIALSGEDLVTLDALDGQVTGGRY